MTSFLPCRVCMCRQPLPRGNDRSRRPAFPPVCRENAFRNDLCVHTYIHAAQRLQKQKRDLHSQTVVVRNEQSTHLGASWVQAAVAQNRPDLLEGHFLSNRTNNVLNHDAKKNVDNRSHACNSVFRNRAALATTQWTRLGSQRHQYRWADNR